MQRPEPPGGVLSHNQVGEDENHGVAREDPVPAVNMLSVDTQTKARNNFDHSVSGPRRSSP